MTSYPTLDIIKLAIGIILFTGTIIFLIRIIKEYRCFMADAKELAHTRTNGQKWLDDARSRFSLIVTIMAIVLLFAFTLGTLAILRIGSETFFADIYTPTLYYTFAIINSISVIGEAIVISIIIYKRNKFK
ncbi:MAG: hypothetical protein IJ504_01045 [Bacteroidales bacterium]|nr:hypothetical protein [Bacteroidales bacterium]